MNLFELFVKIGVDDQASDKLKDLGGKLGNGLKTAAKIGTAAVGAAAAGITALTKAAVDNYAEYEQLVGGVETLFKNSSNTVMKYAKNAYKTAGMSANDYMATATSFAASLINSFKDTSSEITAEMADDMIASLDKQVDAFEEATDAQIKLINKQYMENMKLIDEEEYRRLKAVDDQIAAIEAEEKAEEDAIKKRQQEEEKARLQKIIDAAADAESRQKAEQKLADYIQTLAEQERKQARKDQISALKDEKDVIKEESDAKRNALKEQHDYELEAYKEAREKELSYLKEHLKKQEKAIKASIGTMTEEVSLPAEAYEAAAKATDMAISDMSDNANKMGTDMELIKNAYQGFSKQNYTMLDNLKLGYGGTKTEMERLIRDAAKLDDSVDANSMSFGNIVKAIHAVQDEMGITGTTALEAGRTISGSVGAMKAAWTNLVTGFADKNADLEGLINDLVTTIVGDGTENNLGVIGNVLPAIETALGGVVKLIEGAAPKIIGIFPKLVKRIVPSLISSATSMVNAVIKVLPNLLNTIVDAIIENAPLMIDSALAIVGELVTGILNQLPKLVKLGLDLIVSLANGITENIDTLIPTIIDVVLQIVDTITDPKTLSNLLNASLDIVLALAEGLLSEESINALVDAVWTLIENLVLFVTDLENIEKIQQAGEDILFAIINGMFNSMSKAKENLKEFIINLVNGSFGEIDWQAIGSKLLKNILKNMGPLGLAISAIEKFSSNPDGSHRNGLDYVPYDGYIAELHKGERVLTASEASSYGGTSIGNITINIDGAKYNDEQRLATAIALEIQNMTDRRAAVYA